MKLKNKTALITGGGTGIGYAIAEAFYQAGATVIICGRRKETLQTAKNNIGKTDSRFFIQQADITKQGDVETLIDFAYQATNRIDILVNNAGSMNFSSTVETCMDELRALFEINTFAPFYLTQKILPIMQKQKKGSIINISSFAGLQALNDTSAYCASKAALQMLAQTLALEVGKDNIRVNNICPDVIENTALADHIFGEKYVFEKFYQPSKNLHPIARNGTPNDVANAALFLASDDADWINGINLPIDGGRLNCSNRNAYED